MDNFKILFINPPRSIPLSSGEISQDLFWPPLGIVYPYTVLKNNGYDVEIVDMYYYNWEKTKNFIKNKKYQVVGISCFTEQRYNAIKLAEQIKEYSPETKIVFGGVHASIMHQQILSNKSIDYIVIGESEITILELVDALKNEKDVKNTKGLAFKIGDEVIKTSERNLIDSLDELPFPDFSPFNLKQYPKDLIFKGESFSKDFIFLPVLGSRGCVFNCSYCLVPIFWKKKWRCRSAQNVLDELKTLKKNYTNLFVNFIDDIFTLNRKRVKDICSSIIEERINILWSCFSRVDTVSEDILQLMKKAGCYYISYGVESGSSRILNNINKNISVKEIKEAFNITHKLGIKTEANLIVGLPGEDEESIKESIIFLKNVKSSFPSISLAKIFPATPLYEFAKSKGFINDNYWLTSHPAPFYTLENKLKVLRRWEENLWMADLNLFKKIIRKIRNILKDITGIKIKKGGIEFWIGQRLVYNLRWR